MTATAPSPTKHIADLPDHARVWVYKTARDLGRAEQNLVRDRGAAFTSTWAAHGAPLDSAVEVLHDRFVVIAVDEEQAKASGCSIDKSVGFIKQLEQDLDLTLTDRMIVVYEAKGEITSCRLQDLPELLKDGILTADTIVFDDLVPTVGELRARFRGPLRNTWLQRYL
ncbi:MAG TPA: ABC transporter ATPase [Flavobacteriales bacterium]|nr:ABC transporter ATPase [Flavobacteriales bacterium]